jgi:hypothetical protein
VSGVEDASARPDMGVERGSDASDRGRMDGDLPFSQCAGARAAPLDSGLCAPLSLIVCYTLTETRIARRSTLTCLAG